MVVKNKAGLYIVDPERKGGAQSKPKDARDNESQKAYYTRKYMEIHAARKKKDQSKATWLRWAKQLVTLMHILERWQSGWMWRSRKPLYVRTYRGFESLSLRHL